MFLKLLNTKLQCKKKSQVVSKTSGLEHHGYISFPALQFD